MTPGAAASQEDDLNLEMFRELISQGALRPVQALENEDDFAEWERGMLEDDAFSKSGEELLALGLEPNRTTDGGEAPVTEPDPAAADEEVFVPENPYLEFGKRIMEWPDQGLISKPYPLRVGTGEKLQVLLESYGNFPLWTAESEGDQSPDAVRIDLLPGWDVELVTDLRKPVMDAGTSVPIADWLVVTTGTERLRQVERFINIFAAGVPQIEIEAKIVEVTITDTLDIGITPIDGTTPIFGFPDGTLAKTLDFSFPTGFGQGQGLLTLGSVQDEVAFNAIFQALSTYENVSINSQPKIAVREGGLAKIVNTKKIPFYTVGGLNASGNFSAQLKFEEVGIQLYVVPRVVGTETVALNIDIEASQESGTSVSFAVSDGQGGSTVLENPVITSRSARTIVYLEPGQVVIIGGLISERTVEQQTKIPVLGDIPLLGALFRSTSKRNEQSNVLFFIRPRILQGSDLHRDF